MSCFRDETTKNLASRIGRGIAIASAGALAYLPMNSNADLINLDVDTPLSNDIKGSEMFISHKDNGEEGYDDDDNYWKLYGWEAEGGEPDKYLRPYSNKEKEFYGGGWVLSRDNRPLDSMEPFPLYVDAQDNIGNGITSSGNTLSFRLGAPFDDDQGRKDYMVEVFNYEIPGNTNSLTKIWEGGIRNGIEASSDGEYTLPFTFDVSGAQDDQEVLKMNVTPVDYVIPEPYIPEPYTISLIGIPKSSLSVTSDIELIVEAEGIPSGQNRSFSIEHTPDLVNLSWEELGEYSATNGINKIVDELPDGVNRRFYRLKK